MSTKPILVGYDGSTDSRAALHWALDEARHVAAPVRMVHVFEWPDHVMPIGPGPVGWPDVRAREDADAFMAEAVERARASAPDVAIVGEVHDGPAAATLCLLSAEARSVVLGHRGYGGFGELLLGSVGLAVSAHAHCPVVVVRGEDRPRTPDLPVVVGVDRSTESDLAIGYAFEAAAARGARVVAIRAWEPPQPPRRSPVHAEPFDTVAFETAERRLIDRLVSEWAAKYPAVRITTRLVPGSAGRALVEASANAQLVVVGSRGHGGLTGRLLGSVSQQLLHHAHCPVAVLRESDGGVRPAES